jgi:hypothetical protein
MVQSIGIGKTIGLWNKFTKKRLDAQISLIVGSEPVVLLKPRGEIQNKKCMTGF